MTETGCHFRAAVDACACLIFFVTTNCLMPPKSSYADRVFTTEVVAFPGAIHIDEKKDFTPEVKDQDGYF